MDFGIRERPIAGIFLVIGIIIDSSVPVRYSRCELHGKGVIYT